MTILHKLLSKFENKGVHDAKNQVTPEILMLQLNAKVAREKAEETVRHMKELERQITAYRVAGAIRRIQQ